MMPKLKYGCAALVTWRFSEPFGVYTKPSKKKLGWLPFVGFETTSHLGLAGAMVVTHPLAACAMLAPAPTSLLSPYTTVGILVELYEAQNSELDPLPKLSWLSPPNTNSTP